MVKNIDLIKNEPPFEKDVRKSILDREFWKFDNYNGPKENFYQIWTKEYISALANYISARYDKSDIILEVCAGEGLLTLYLNQILPHRIIATDSHKWIKKFTFPPFVKKYSTEEAVTHFSPKLVLVSWLPLNLDLTPLFRSCGSVHEYIVIGEAKGGCTGNEQVFESHEGFYQEDILKEIGHYCKSDYILQYSSFEDIRWHSKTTAFRRIK